MTSDQPESTTTRDDWAAGLAERLGGEAVVEFDTVRISVDREKWLPTLRRARDEEGLVFFSWLAGIDWSKDVEVGEGVAEPDDQDSEGGAGLTIPPSAISATLTFDHWYETESGADGGVVLVDPVDNGIDDYVVLVPNGGYPAGVLAGGGCNALEGLDAFHGASGSWITSTFDLSAYAGATIHVAFVFGSDNQVTFDEGWYVDNIRVEYEENGATVCDPVSWPGTVPKDATFALTGAGTIQASWGGSCNLGALPGQQYSIQAGSLDSLRQGFYDHAPVDGMCDRSSPSSFGHGVGNEYYLIVPNEATRDGGAGTDPSGNPRPAGSGDCGVQRIDSCG